MRGAARSHGGASPVKWTANPIIGMEASGSSMPVFCMSVPTVRSTSVRSARRVTRPISPLSPSDSPHSSSPFHCSSVSGAQLWRSASIIVLCRRTNSPSFRAKTPPPSAPVSIACASVRHSSHRSSDGITAARCAKMPAAAGSELSGAIAWVPRYRTATTSSAPSQPKW